MDFGVFNLMQQRDASVTAAALVDDAVEITCAAENLGLARAWFAEHHFSSYSLSPSPLMMVSHVAALTTRIRLGTAVLVAPLHAPARLAGEIALADTLSNGRLDLGLGNGYQQFEFERFGVPLEERRERTFELLDLLEQSFADGVYVPNGTHYKLPSTPINVSCIQRPHPPIWLASGDDTVNQRTARQGYTPFVSSRFASREELLPIREHIATAFRRMGNVKTAMPLGVLGYCCVSEQKRDIEEYVSAARYQQRISRSLREHREQLTGSHQILEQPVAGEPSLAHIAEHILVGDPNIVAERLANFIEVVHPTHMMFYFQVGGFARSKALQSMSLFVERVIPLVEVHFGRTMNEIEGVAA